MGNPFIHLELNTPDIEKAKAFYSKLFDWQFQDMPSTAVPGATYTMIDTGERPGAGILEQVQGGPIGWLAYVAVTDINAATQKAKSLGAQVMKDVTEVPGMGWFSFIRDPTGAALGLWQTKTK